MNFIFPDRLIFGQHKHKQTNGPIKMNPNDDDHHNSHENDGAKAREKKYYRANQSSNNNDYIMGKK